MQHALSMSCARTGELVGLSCARTGELVGLHLTQACNRQIGFVSYFGLVYAAGMIEYWSGTDCTFPQDAVNFKLKLDTDLYALAKAKTSSKSLELSKDGSQFAIFSTDRQASD